MLVLASPSYFEPKNTFKLLRPLHGTQVGNIIARLRHSECDGPGSDQRSVNYALDGLTHHRLFSYSADKVERNNGQVQQAISGSVTGQEQFETLKEI